MDSNGTCDTKTLSLSSRYVASALCNRRIVSLLPLLDEFIGTGDFGCFLPLFIGPAIVAKSDVLFDSTGEEKSFLRDKSNQGMKGLLFPVFDIHAINKDFAFGCIVNTSNQAGNCTLTTACPSDDSKGLSFFYLEGDMFEPVFLSIRITEGNILELEASLLLDP